MRDGWNYTGDAYLVDDDGYFHFQARADDMITSSGYNISGIEVESALLDETLHYSRTGAEAMPRLIANQIERDGGDLLPGHSVEHVHLRRGAVNKVTCSNREQPEKLVELHCDRCVSTIPVPLLIEKIVPRPPAQGTGQRCCSCRL